MKNTNEIEKQLKLKADKYIKQKAKEMFEIHREIALYLGTSLPSFIDYITHVRQYDEAIPENKSDHTAYCSPSDMEKKFKLELESNYKNRLVAKYTKELITKLDIFE
jgi:hypothetical protein